MTDRLRAVIGLRDGTIKRLEYELAVARETIQSTTTSLKNVLKANKAADQKIADLREEIDRLNSKGETDDTVRRT